MMTLEEAKAECRRLGFRWLTIDADGRYVGHNEEPAFYTDYYMSHDGKAREIGYGERADIWDMSEE